MYWFNCQNILFLFFSSLFFLSCNIFESENSIVRRDYQWTIDTLSKYNQAISLWGASVTDIWATTYGYESREFLLHFDGVKWSPFPLSNLNFDGVFGFKVNDVYLCGPRGKILHFNGSSWEPYAEVIKDGDSNIYFHNLWGKTSSDFYVFGATPDTYGLIINSVIARFQNNNYTFLNTSSIKGMVTKCLQDAFNQKLYFTVRKGMNGLNDSSFVYEYSDSKFKKIIATTWYDQASNIALLNNKVYFVRKNEILKREEDNFKVLLEVPGQFGDEIWGRTERDIFLEKFDGIAHYNGFDIEYLIKFNGTPSQIRSALIFERDVFFFVYELGKKINLMYHGKLE